MLNRMPSLRFRLLLAFIVGAVLAFVMVPVTAYMVAIAAPAGFFAWFKGHGLLLLALLLWQVFVTYGLGMALPVAIVLLLLFRLYPGHRVALAACLGGGVLTSLYLLVPVCFGEAVVSPFALPWWQQGLVVSLLLAYGLVLCVSRIMRMTVRPGGGHVGAA